MKLYYLQSYVCKYLYLVQIANVAREQLRKDIYSPVSN